MGKRCSKKESISWWHAPSKVFAYVQHYRSPIFFAEWTKLYSRIAISKLSQLSIRIEILQRSSGCSAYCRGTLWPISTFPVGKPSDGRSIHPQWKPATLWPISSPQSTQKRIKWISPCPLEFPFSTMVEWALGMSSPSPFKGAVGAEQHVHREPPWSTAAGIQSNRCSGSPCVRWRPGYLYYLKISISISTSLLFFWLKKA